MSLPVIEVDTGTPQVRALFTTRRGGMGCGPFGGMNLAATTGDDPGVVRTNRRMLAGALGFDERTAVVLRQMHGAGVVRVGPAGGAGAFTGSLDGLAEADAAVTGNADVALLALGADCPSVVMWDAGGGSVAAIHAGWRGILGGVIGAAVAAMPCEPGAVRAAVGPRVGACCYPVDARMRDAMSGEFGRDVIRGDAVDLGAACVQALAGAGVGRDRVTVVEACTACDAGRFFSYRRDGAATGRQAGIVWIEARS